MVGLDPQAADRAADFAGTDDADFGLAARRLRPQACRPQRSAEEQRTAAGEHCTAAPIDRAMFQHWEYPSSQFSERLYELAILAWRISIWHHGCVRNRNKRVNCWAGPSPPSPAACAAAVGCAAR